MMKRIVIVMAAMAAAGLVAAACTSSAPTSEPAAPASQDQVELTQEATTCPTEGEEFEVAKLYIEHNATDADTGVHGLFGGDAWTEVCVTAPDGRQILVVDPLDQLNDLAIADFFFESREPPNDEVSIEAVLAGFPEGDYTVAGTDFEGVARVGTAVFSHAIPAEPVILAPELAEDAEVADEAVGATTDLVVAWEPVTETIAGEPVRVSGYEVIITKEDHEDPNGLSRPVYDVHVGPDATSLGVPPEFFVPDEVYELEVIVIEQSGNQTIGLGFFTSAAVGAAEEAIEWEDDRTFVDPNQGVTIGWEAVTSPAGVEVEPYALQLFPVDPPEGEDPIALNIDYTLEVPADVTSVVIPPEILQRGVEYEFELMVIDASVNQTFAVGGFATSAS